MLFPSANVLALLLIPLAFLPGIVLLYAIVRAIRRSQARTAAADVAPTPLSVQFDVPTGLGETTNNLLMELGPRLTAGGYVLAGQTPNDLTWVRFVNLAGAVGADGFDASDFAGSAVTLPPNVRRVNVSVHGLDAGGSRVSISGVGDRWMINWLR